MSVKMFEHEQIARGNLALSGWRAAFFPLSALKAELVNPETALVGAFFMRRRAVMLREREVPEITAAVFSIALVL